MIENVNENSGMYTIDKRILRTIPGVTYSSCKEWKFIIVK
jgi:hypothetical protein